MLEYAWYFENNTMKMARIINRGAHASLIEFRDQGVVWQILVSNDDIEFIGDDRLDDDED